MFLKLHNYEINIYKYIFNEKWVVIGSKRVHGRNSHLPPILTKRKEMGMKKKEVISKKSKKKRNKERQII